MIGPLRRANQIAADRTAIACGEIELTYAETWERCRRLAGGLRGLGIGVGDRVGDRRRRTATATSSCTRPCRAPAWCSSRSTTRHTDAELRYALEDSAAARAVHRPRRSTACRACVEHVIDLDDGYEALLADARSGRLPGATSPSTTSPGLFYTGGTTGAAKGVMLTHRNLDRQRAALPGLSGRSRPDTCWLDRRAAVPCRGLDRRAGDRRGPAGARSCCPPSTRRPRSTSSSATASRPRCVVPTMLAALTEEQLRSPSRRLSRCGDLPRRLAGRRPRRCAAPTPPSPTPSCSHIYGATETAPIATSLPHEERVLDAPRARSCGQPAVGVEVAIVGADGRAGARR